ncbi:MAG: hypothetical protein H0T50_04390 [Gemmatimonadales bacterium]|nr:hypothetical protein [Gemmatimonadales bacterium]
MLRVAFGHGRFGPEAIGQLWWLLIALGGVWVGGAAGQILGPAFYAQGDTRTPTRVGSIGFTLAIVLKIAGFYFFGIWGVAAGYSVQYAVSSVALYVLLERRLRSPKSVALPVERVGVS